MMLTSKVALSAALSAPDLGTYSQRGPMPVGLGSPGPYWVSTPAKMISRSRSYVFLLP
jgi:hypothetical protein